MNNKNKILYQKDGSVVKNVCCSSRGPGFGASTLSGGSEPPVISASGVPVPSPGLQGHMHSYSTHTCTKNQSISGGGTIDDIFDQISKPS